MSRFPRMINLRKLVLMVLTLALVATACTSADEGGTTGLLRGAGGLDGDSGAPATTVAASTGEEEAPAPEDRDAMEPETADEGGFASILPVVLQTSDLGRDIIFTADLTVAVTDVAGAEQEATRLIQGLGGFLFGQRTLGAPEPQSILTFKVQPDDFQEALSRLGSIGEVRSQNVSADDVTERIVDLESRISTAAASVERLRGLLDQAVDIKSIVELENELVARETQLETLRGQLRTFQDQVALATIVLTLTEAATRPAIDLSVTAYPAHDDGLSCPGSMEVVVQQDTEATVCFEITNVGDTLLTGFTLRDPVLDIEIDDLVVVFGDPETAIEPGESIILAVEVIPARSLRTQTAVTAEPVDEEGEPLPGRPAASTVSIFVDVVDPGGIPTFTEGLGASWDLLVGFGQVLVLVAAALIPFFWVPLVLWLAWRMRRTSVLRSSADPSVTPEGHSDQS
jgi:hypothetical protein